MKDNNLIELKPKKINTSNANFEDHNMFSLPESVLINVYSSISPKKPYFNKTKIIKKIDIPKKWVESGNEYIGLLIDNDEMSPRIQKNDIVIIKLFSKDTNNSICAVFNNESNAIIRKVCFDKEKIALEPLNNEYDTIYTNYKNTSMLGKIVEARRQL